MISNARPHLGVIAAAAPFGWKLLLNVGIPLVLGAGAIALTGAAVKGAVPEIPINKKSVGKAALAGGAGIAAYYLSDLLPQEWRPAAYIGAVAGVAGALYFLFSEPAPEAPPEIIPSRTVPPREQMPALTPGPMLQALTLFVDPDQPNTGGTRRWPWGDQEFEIIVKNEMDRPVTFFVGLVTSGEDAVTIYRSPIVDPKYGRKRVTLGPGQDQIVKVKSPAPAGILKDVAVSFELFRQGEDTAPFRTSDAVPITYTYLPIF